MSFADTLKDVPKKKSFIQAREEAMNGLIKDIEKSIKVLATDAAKNNYNSISGFLCKAASRATNELKLVSYWEENVRTAQSPCKESPILRVDRFLYRAKGKSANDTYSCFMYQYQGFVHYSENYNADLGNEYLSMSDSNIEELRIKVEKCICELGFTKYEIKIIPKQFLYFYKTHTFWKKLDTITYKNGDLGKVMYISISW